MLASGKCASGKCASRERASRKRASRERVSRERASRDKSIRESSGRGATGGKGALRAKFWCSSRDPFFNWWPDRTTVEHRLNNWNVLFIGQIDYCYSVVVLESIMRCEAPQALYKRRK